MNTKFREAVRELLHTLNLHEADVSALEIQANGEVWATVVVRLVSGKPLLEADGLPATTYVQVRAADNSGE